MLIEDAAASGQQFEDLQKINGAGKKLLDLVNDLLDLSKFAKGGMRMSFEVTVPDADNARLQFQAKWNMLLSPVIMKPSRISFLLKGNHP